MMRNKRSSLPRRVDYTRTFAKSWERYNKAGRHDMSALVEVMTRLFHGSVLPASYCDHQLKGEQWEGARELHIGGDFLLVYRFSPAQNLLTFIDIGTHSELFG
ncbi:type II toxin-antitoxin system YafQ family toxin [Siccibacter colletis]|uniref:type II toxin-antitoxin system YafQ family toxin n=1 Tax=Siccibacter colletis TaxID=1505757 RepID=UPI0028BE29F1|nr:type II toxin-antitoxin system YafQ family toxin [Siccibacter colletis]WNN48272.1 type II toxin-antitoxin system YafQ family toxin [Siccibacter colletis]